MSRDVDEKARGQRPVDTETENLRSRGQRDQVWSPNQEVKGHKART